MIFIEVNIWAIKFGSPTCT